MSSLILGQCHCGSVEWEAQLPTKIILNCHCNMCRQLSGADYSAWVVVAADQFRIKTGGETVSHYQASEQFAKSFCSQCGSTVSCVNNDKFPQHIYVARGNIVSDFSQPAEVEVYTSDKASWVKLNDDIPDIGP